MYHVSAQGIDERMINVHYYYYRHCLLTLSLMLNKTLKWCTSLPVLMQNCSGGDNVVLGIVPPHTHTQPHTDLSQSQSLPVPLQKQLCVKQV